MSQSTYDLIESLEIDRDWQSFLMEEASSCGIDFLSSPCDLEAVNQLGELGVPAFKLASFDLPDLDLIRQMARFGKPLILSTGMADYTDIQQALFAAKEAGNEHVVLLQCTSLYPAPVELTDLAVMSTLERAFGVPVGYSDHTLGEHICLAAVARGACVLEKHFTLDRTLPGPDHSFAIEPEELKQMIQHIRDIEKAIGDGIKAGPRPAEQEHFEKGRRSLHVKRKVSVGDVIREEDLCIKRPGYGIPPRLKTSIIGMMAKKEIPDDHWISWDDLK